MVNLRTLPLLLLALVFAGCKPDSALHHTESIDSDNGSPPAPASTPAPATPPSQPPDKQ